MNKIWFLILFFVLVYVDIHAQVITGKVCDKATGLPIDNAHVYLNGSSYFTVTNEAGEYHLNVANKIKTQLIISHLSYETMVINNPFDKVPDVIYLKEKAFEIDEVAVTAKAGRFTRQQRLKAFELQFLGDNKARKFCKIQNSDDIYLYFNENNGTLSAISEQPVIVENEYLGYQIHCTIAEFKIKFLNNRSLSERNIESVLFRCYTFLIDKAPGNPVIQKRRDEAYKSSSNYFFKNLANQTLTTSNHLVYQYGHQNLLDLEQFFEIKDRGTEKLVRVKSSSDYKIIIDNPNKYPYPVAGIISVEDHAGYASNILFLTDEFSVDVNGFVDKWNYIGITGQMDNQRIGCMVPFDYELLDGISTAIGRQARQRLLTYTPQRLRELSTISRQSSIPDSLTSLFNNQLAVFPQEKIYIHTDKPYYISGERIWFRAYLADAITHIPTPISRYVYIELVTTASSRCLTRIKIRQAEGAYHGHLFIPDDAPEGDYILRAYTTFMQSQDKHYFFTKNIRIGDPQTRTALINTQAPVPENDFDVSFYPEGGSLMLGTACNITFKALKSNGRATDISGIIYDQSGVEIQKISSDYLGMGCFSFTAEKGKSYYAVCENDKGQSKRFDLPAAIDKGYALSVNRSADRIYVTVLQPAKSTQNNELYLLAHTRGKVHLAMLWDNDKNRVDLPKEQFPSGVLHLILFDAGLNPVSERLVFINNQDQAGIDVQSDQPVFTARSCVKNRITITDSDGEPLAGSFSVAVTSDSEVMPDTASNILTYLLLTSDLRGTIENPAYYFRDNPSSEQALDLLMRTQGWRRYDIAALAKGRFSRPTTPIEAGAEISGTVKSVLTGKPVENISI